MFKPKKTNQLAVRIKQTITTSSASSSTHEQIIVAQGNEKKIGN
jgi:hypothetical protein